MVLLLVQVVQVVVEVEAVIRLVVLVQRPPVVTKMVVVAPAGLLPTVAVPL